MSDESRYVSDRDAETIRKGVGLAVAVGRGVVILVKVVFWFSAVLIVLALVVGM
ncbi:MAG: hypothetical protein ABI349_08475 [Casimicrobiaceae bacterium]